MRKFYLLIRIAAVVASLLAALSLAACSSRDSHLKLAPVSQLRADLREAPVRVREAYQFALANPDILNKIPCYCSCGAVHKSVKDCFVREVRPDGTIVWDDMGKG